MGKISKLKSELASRHLYDGSNSRDKERVTMCGFLDRLNLDPTELDQRERPDFRISFGGVLSVGVELTLLNSDGPRAEGSPERRLHSQWKKVAECLRNRLCLEESPLPHVYGSVFFNRTSASVLNELDCNEFCDEVIAVLRTAPLSETGSNIVDFDPRETPILSKEVEHLYVRIFPSDSGFLWWCSDLQSGCVAAPDKSIKDAVREKQTKAVGYEWGDSQERWLLIYAAGEGLADHALGFEDLGIDQPDPFTCIFLWDKFTETIHCISPVFETVVDRGRMPYVQHLPETIRPYVKLSR